MSGSIGALSENTLVGAYPQMRAYPQERIGVRDAYRRVMHKGDPEVVPMLS